MADEHPATDCDFATSVPDWIIEHPETMSVFPKFGIDYSCGGKSLGYVCDQQGVDVKLLLKALRQKIKTPATVKGEETNGDSACESGRCD
jgi:regulator of cell morphogenesis and NO signaling